MMHVFIDGRSGTTGLRIYERLQKRSDIRLITLSEELRKDAAARQDALNRADIVFLCLPDDAAREAVSFVENPNTVVIDTSTAHRTAEGWVYGFPEISTMRQKIVDARRIANPGCHASGFIALIAPLVEKGLMDRGTHLSCFSLTGYSGGGKSMIAEYETEGRDKALVAPRMYGLSQTHKHLPEMTALTALMNPPIFCPVVADFYSGMEVVVPLEATGITKSAAERVYGEYYKTGLVHFRPDANEHGFLSASAMAGRDDMELTVCGTEERPVAVARFDNLGKGASGSAIQNMNLVMGLDECTGLICG